MPSFRSTPILCFTFSLPAARAKPISDELDQVLGEPMQADADGSDKSGNNEMNLNELNADRTLNGFNKNRFSVNLLEMLQNEIEDEESVAYKSALLLKMLEVNR